MYDLIIIGAGPGGIALAAEACASGINQSQILVLEKGATHNAAIRQLYPDQKLTTANYKGFDARCKGLLCVSDMSKSETIEFFDKVIADYRINIQFNAEVFGMQYLHAQVNRVTLSYRQTEFSRLSKQNHDTLFAMEERNEVEILRGSNIKQVEDEAGRPHVVFNESECPARTF